MTWHARLDDDGGPVVTVTEPDGGQVLEFRVGPVFLSDGSEDTGIWVTYLEHAVSSYLHGPVLVDVGTWQALNRAVSRRLRRHLAGQLRKQLRTRLHL